ncbi:MAG: polysaccharide deacetylase family protein [Candidatus Micrarchaeota archaeon]
MFALRVDIDSRYGLMHGVPNILAILKDCGIKASFAAVMGGESGIADLLRYRGGERGLMGGSRLPLSDRVRMALMPVNFAQEQKPILEEIMRQGHTLGVHGWKHRLWTRALDSIDVSTHVRMATEKYAALFGRRPSHFVAPGFRSGSAVLEALDEQGYALASDLPGEAPFRPVVGGKQFKCVQVPVTLKAADTSPLTEHYAAQGIPDAETARRICDEVLARENAGRLSTLYAHDVFEGTFRPKLLEAVLKSVCNAGIELTTFEALAERGKNNEVQYSFDK